MSMPRRRVAEHPTVCGHSRREFLWETGAGFTGLALLDLLSRDGFFDRLRAEDVQKVQGLLAPRKPHFEPGATRCVFLFMNGGPSQVDTFDPKPLLEKHHDTKYDGGIEVGSNGRPIGYLMKSPFPFQQHGESGLPISSLYPNLARHADDLCVIRSMHTDTAAHASGCIQMNTGKVGIGSPSLGSWVNYGLGTENQQLPGFVVMIDPRGGPIGSASNWSSGYLPAAYQGTHFRSGQSPVLNLRNPDGVSLQGQRSSLDLLNSLNQEHFALRQNESELEARIESYELAFRMQAAARDVVDLSRESKKTHERYGLDNPRTEDFGRKCLITKRLLERGVRYIQLYSGGGHIEDTWDGHTDCISNHKLHAAETDRPMAALMQDMKDLGLWDETLFVWGGEFGRTPTSEGVGKPGRDHDWHGFTMWLAGGGVKGGQAIGATDELGFAAVDQPVHVRDLHATILHLMGLDHEELSYFYQGLDQRLTGPAEAHVVQEVLA